MNKRTFANRFGLIALMSLSLFASSHAFAGNSGPTQVVVTNTPAQPVPMVGLITDSDAPARKSFVWSGSFNGGQGGSNANLVTTVPANQRLVVEDVSGYCTSGINYIALNSYDAADYTYHYLPATFWNGTGPASVPVRFYVNPNQQFNFSIGGPQYGTCYLAVSGYYVNLP